jgi:transketolase
VLTRIPQKDWYPTERGFFPGALYNEMIRNSRIWMLTGDLGYGQFDKIRDDFPDRFMTCGASEQAMVGIAIGLAMEGFIPFVHTMSSFLLNRPYEWIRNYLNKESIPVKLVGSGRGLDYHIDSFTHEAEDTKYILDGFPNIVQFWPEDKFCVEEMVHEMVINGKPSFISLTKA